jgi:hypothetical protein
MENLPGFDALAQMSDKQLQNLFGVRDFFVYELDFGSVAAAGTASSSFTVQADSNFLWQYGNYFADLAGAAQTDSGRVIPLMSATILDTSSGRQLMSAAVPIASLFGTGQLPFLLPTPRFFRAQTQVTVNVTNFSAATAYVTKLQFIGTKFFKFAQTL